MSLDSPTSPAPGRHVLPLPRGWAAVFLCLFPGQAPAAVGLFQGEELQELVDEPEDVRAYVRLYAMPSP